MYNHTPPHILIIDDEPSILKLLSKILSCENFKIDIANNGKDGIKKIELNNYDLILTDIKMPEVSGNDVLQHIKENKNSFMPIVGMSGTS